MAFITFKGLVFYGELNNCLNARAKWQINAPVKMRNLDYAEENMTLFEFMTILLSVESTIN